MELTPEVPHNVSQKDPVVVARGTPTLPGHKKLSVSTKDAIVLLSSAYIEPSFRPLAGLSPCPLYGVTMSIHLNTGKTQECCKPQDTLNLGSHPLLGDSPRVTPS